MSTAPATPKDGFFASLLKERPFLACAFTLAVFQFGGDRWLEELADPFIAAVLFAWIFAAALWGAFGVVRHADALADLLGEPYGTLILTIAVTGIEATLIAAVMLIGDGSPTLARDTMYAALMIVLNGFVGLALLIGGLRHGEQEYNLRGARAFIAVLLPLSVFALILPDFTVSTPDPTFAPFQAAFFALITVLLYGVFLGIQTSRHRAFFEEPDSAGDVADHPVAPAKDRRELATRSEAYHALFLLLTLVPLLLLSKRLAELVDFGIVEVGAPAALGGFMIALLVLTPEGLAALGAARANRLQRSVNLLLGAALATIGLTLPAVLAISLVIAEPLTLGLDPAPLAMLVLTLLVGMLTFGGVRTSILQGAVHLVLFLAYIMLIFNP